MIEKKDIPVCHNEPMIPVLRYVEDGEVIVRYQCAMRHCSETINVMVKTLEEKREISDALDRFAFMWKQRGDDP